MEGRRSHLPPIPENYISLRHLQEKRLKEKEEEERRQRRLIEQQEEEEERRRGRLIEQEEEERKKLAEAVEGLVFGGSGDRRQEGEGRTVCREVRVSEGEEGVLAVATARKMEWTKKRKGKKKRDGAVALVVAGDGETAAIGACTADLAAPGVKTEAVSGAKARSAAAAVSKIGGGGEGEEAGAVVGKGEEGRREAKGRGRQAKSAAAVVEENGGERVWAEKREEVRSEARGKGRGRPVKSAATLVGEEGRTEAKGQGQGRGRPMKSAAVVGEKGGGRGWAKKGGVRRPTRGDEVGQMWVPKCGGSENC